MLEHYEIGRGTLRESLPTCARNSQKVVDVMRKHIDDQAVFLEMNQKFHLVTAEGSGNALFHCTLDAHIGLLDGSAVGIHYKTSGVESTPSDP